MKAQAAPLLLVFILAGSLHAEAPLDPSGPPAPTMKSLQEIWDKIGELEAQVSGLQGQLGDLTAFLGAAIEGQEMVAVGNPGNAPDTNYGIGAFGAVSYEYRIGKYEVTNTQYAQFLNAVAMADTNSLYDTGAGSDVRGGITRSGSSGSYSYAVKTNMGNKPVNYVNWYDAARYCNWLHNGRPSGAQDASTTEDGAYTLTGVTSIGAGSDPTHGANGRNSGAKFHLPSENEWYKAAYHHPASQGGDTDSYWFYPTRSNGPPTVATADATGNINNDTANIANYIQGADWNGQDGNVTTVGSGGPGSASFYGAFDMGGNIYEWTEQAGFSVRILRAGSWFHDVTALRAATHDVNNPNDDEVLFGFRVASP